MEPKRVALSLLLCTSLAVPAGLPVARPAEAETTSDIGETLNVSRFLIDIARAVDPALEETATVEQAVDSLAAAGLEVPDDLDPDGTVTEGDVVRFASAAGLRLRSREPREPFPPSKMASLRVLLVGSIRGADELASAGALGGDEKTNNAGGSDRAREKRKKKKVFERPSIPPGQEGKD